MAEDNEQKKEEVVPVKAKPYSRPRRHTQKQKNFIQETIKDPTSTLADRVIRAGYNVKNRDVASSLGNQLINKPYVESELKKHILEGNLDQKAIEALKEILVEDTSTMDKVSERVASRKLKLEVAKEISNIQGNYAPKRSETKKAVVNFNLPPKKV